MNTLKGIALGILLSAGMANVSAQFPEGPESYGRIGRMQTRSSSEIAKSTWSIGGETLDRGYADFSSYRKYLGQLGAKRIRLQGGWAKCEKEKGVYDFRWLDDIVNDVVAQGVNPWVELSYGNPIYEGGGEAKLGGALPGSPEALEAWDNWVAAMTERYKDKVPEWEIWNEPDLTPKITGESYADFYIRTAENVKRIQPKARLLAMGLAGVGKSEFVRAFFETLKAKSKLHLIDVLTFHGYPSNPDDLYPAIERLRTLVHGYAPTVELMQGENGCPSTPSTNSVGALRKLDWTELSQAKYLTRRMLGDYGRAISTNVFTLSDLHYAPGDHMVGVNSKGLLKTHPDKTISHPKMSYYAVQRIMGLFDADQERIPGIDLDKLGIGSDSISVYGYRHRARGAHLFSLWSHAARPAESFKPVLKDLTFPVRLREPVFVDLLSGDVYRIPDSDVRFQGNTTTIKGVPIPDYGVLVADMAGIPIKEGKN